jgi:uncharacterized protein YdaU (DUF1376 family)
LHYYQFNIADYRKDTVHLSRLEHGIYRDLIDWYYLDERPIPTETQVVSRRLRLASEEDLKSLKNVLSDFFVESEDGFRHVRIDQDIAQMRLAQKNHWATKLSRHERTAIQAARNAQKNQATPRWLSDDDRRLIIEIYSRSSIVTASTGIKHEVDHIVPIRSSVVCGLHVPWNLRILPATENRKKSNKFEVIV